MREIRRIKARVEAERLPRGADPALHTKLGRGGLADVEWTVQLLQLRHGRRGPGAAHHPHAGRAGRGRAAPGCSSRDDAAVLRRGLAAGHPDPQRGDAGPRPRRRTRCPRTGRELAAVARLLGYAPDAAQDLAQDRRRAARRARAVMERVFYG